MSKIFFIDGSPLWVSGIKVVGRDVIKGFVENGCWDVSINTRTKTVGVVGDRERQKYKKIQTVVVPPGSAEDNYNDVIAWAERELKKRGKKSKVHSVRNAGRKAR